jgi:hypothetical protein
LVKIVLGPILGVIGAYAISTRAFQRDKKRSEKKERDDRRSYTALFFNRLEDLDRHAQSQVGVLRATADELMRLGNHDFAYSQVARFNYSRVEEMDDSRLYVALIEDDGLDDPERRRAYLELIGSVDFLANIPPHLIGVFDKLNADYRMLQKNWDAGIRAIDLHISAWKGLHVANMMSPEDPFLDEIVELHGMTFMPEHGDADLSMSELAKNFIEPLFGILNTHGTDPRCLELAPHAGECRNAYLNLEKVKLVARGSFVEFADGIERARATIRTNVATLRMNS